MKLHKNGRGFPLQLCLGLAAGLLLVALTWWLSYSRNDES